MVYRIGDRVKFCKGIYEGKTGIIQGLPSEGSSKYTIMLDDGKTVKFSKEFFEIMNDNNDGNEIHESYQDKGNEDESIDQYERWFNMLCDECKKTVIAIEDEYNIDRKEAMEKALIRKEICNECKIKLIKNRMIKINNDIDEDEINERMNEFFEYINKKLEKEMPDIINAKTNKKEMENFFKLIEYLRDDGVIIKIDSIKHGEMEMELPVIRSIFVDPGHVAMMNISLLPDEINENAKGIEFAIDPNTIKRFLKHYESKDEMIFHRIENNKLFLKHEGIEFAIGLLDPDECFSPKEPELHFTGNATLPVKKLRKTLRSINEITDIAQIEIKHDKVIVYGENDGDHIKAIFKKDECDEINIIDDSDEIRSMYNIGDYLKGFIDLLYSLKIDKVKIEMAKDYPIRIHFKTGNIQGYFLLAPRIEY